MSRIPKPHTPKRSIPVLNLDADSRAKTPQLSQRLGESLEEFGFVGLSNHGIDDTVINRCYTAGRRFFALPEATKLAYFDPGGRGARGYIPFGREKAKDQSIGDLKEFWHVGREPEPFANDGAPASGRAAPAVTAFPLPPNVWPEEIDDFRASVVELYTALERLGRFVLSLIAVHLGARPNLFDDKVDHGNSVLRLLHYPPVNTPPLGASHDTGAVRAAAHEDINLITLLVGAEGPGLEILTRSGEWLPAPSGRAVIVCNVGDMLQRLTNHVLPSTRHRVVNPPPPWSDTSRYSMPFFLHPNSEYLIETLPQCISTERPNRYPSPITADDYLSKRLVEIGLAPVPAKPAEKHPDE